MASRRENLLRVTVDAATAGLDLSKDRGSIDERMLWEAENVWRSQRGVITKRPAFKQYATQIVEPTDVSTAAGEVVSIVADNKADWVVVKDAGVYAQFSHNDLIVSGWYASPAQLATISRPKKVTEEFSTLNAGTLSMVIRGTNIFDDEGYFKCGFATKAGTEMRVFSIGAGGMYIQTGSGTWGLIADTTALCDGEAHRLDIKWASNTYSVHVDGVVVGSGLGWSYKIDGGGDFIKFFALADDGLPDDPYMFMVSSIILRDSSDGIYTPAISAICSQKRYVGNLSKNIVLVAGEKYIWIEYDNSGIWQPLCSKSHDKTTFVPFRNYIVIINYSDLSNFSTVHILDSNGAIEQITGAPQCRFGAEFADRLWLSGDPNNPKRLYYSGDRNPRLWIVPETGTDYTLVQMLDAGYFDLPSGTDERINLVSGKFFGTLLAATDNAVYGIFGNSPQDFSKRVVSAEIGSAGARCGSGGLNDFMFLNKNGIASIVTTDKFGDILSERKSYAVNALFDPHNIGPRTLNQAAIRNSVLEFYQPLSILAMFVPSVTASTPNKVYTCQFPEMLWYGPFNETATCAATVQLATPATEYMCIGTPDGRVKFLAPLQPDSSTFKMSSAVIDGRSLDPSLRMMVKSWKHLRVFVNPTGDWNITIKWKTDTGKWQVYTAGKLAGKNNAFVGTARTGGSMADDRSERHLIEVPLDVRGTSLKWEITGTAPKLSGLAVEVDFHVSGYEKED
jgi:hypothetical protein